MNDVAVVGVGQALARRLLAAEFAVHGFDLRPEACDALNALGGQAVESVSDLGATCSCVVLAVFDTRDVINVLGELGSLREPSQQGSVRTVIDCSTGDPQALQDLAARLRERGIAFIEGPLSGSSQQIADGEATQLLGGEPDAIARNAAVLDAIAPQRIHVGPAGMAAKAKLATLEAARGAGQPLPLSEAHARPMRGAIAAGDGDLDNAAIIRQWRRDRTPDN